MNNIFENTILVRRYYLSVPNELEEKQLIFENGNAFIVFLFAPPLQNRATYLLGFDSVRLLACEQLMVPFVFCWNLILVITSTELCTEPMIFLKKYRPKCLPKGALIKCFVASKKIQNQNLF